MSEIEIDVNRANQERAEQIQELEDRLDRLERTHRPMDLASMMNRLVPTEVRQHLRAARREQLLAARTWLDVLIDRVDEAEPKGGRRRRIDVE